LLEDAFHAVWAGNAESDGFNRLTVAAELPWREIVILRAIAKFLRQAGLMLSQTYVENAVVKYPAIAIMLVSLFRSLHAPGLFATADTRAGAASGIREKIETALNNVPNADDDRIIRAMVSVIDAMLRTSFFQPSASGGMRPYLAFKLDSKRLAMLPGAQAAL